MSRLYATMTSDGKGIPASRGAHEDLDITVSWGSVKHSKKAVNVTVTWGRAEDTPTVYVSTGAGIKELVVNGVAQR